MKKIYLNIQVLWLLNCVAVISAGLLSRESRFLPLYVGHTFGGLLFILGAATYFLSYRHLEGGHLKPEYTKKLVRTGVYSKVRHPAYLGIILMGMGLFLLFSEPVSALVEAFFIGGWLAVSKEEEKILLRKFGEDYERYKKETGFIFPRIWEIG